MRSLLALVIASTLVGCGGGDGGSNSPSDGQDKDIIFSVFGYGHEKMPAPEISYEQDCLNYNTLCMPINGYWMPLQATNHLLDVKQGEDYYNDGLLWSEGNYEAYNDFDSGDISVPNNNENTYFIVNITSLQGLYDDPSVSSKNQLTVAGRTKLVPGVNQILLSDIPLPLHTAVFTLVGSSRMFEAGYEFLGTELTVVDEETGYIKTSSTGNTRTIFEGYNSEYTTHIYELSMTKLQSIKIRYRNPQGSIVEDTFDENDAINAGMDWETGQHFVITYDFMMRDGGLSGQLDIAKGSSEELSNEN
ncbi:hypothetical protein [Vibrio superstes]|uniref:Lipoprotein n=1 Tax=Vibrio superstes NBRC 103154 TaxID=1219062 RepID=A0A511QQ41_9VIBR|nr:hypothetical protein [Vibrio superstes]GEM79455.1 hypothetical protein VSU01S_17000 [Vibrio superstes NBRC 103154]